MEVKVNKFLNRAGGGSNLTSNPSNFKFALTHSSFDGCFCLFLLAGGQAQC